MSNTTRWLQAPTGGTVQTYSGVMDRLLIGSIWPTEGILGLGHLKVAQRAAGANMSVDVAAGSAAITNDWVSNGGAYHTNESATVNVAIPAAPASGTRTHIIVEQINDPQSDGGTNYVSAPACIADTGSGQPATPKSALLLATVSVAAGTASITNALITDKRNLASGIPDSVGQMGYSDTLTSAGRVTVSHGLGSKPSNVLFSMAGGGNGGVEVYLPNMFFNSTTPDASTFILEFVKSDGTTGQGGQTVVFNWQAWR
jgi:hypothetical protein